MMASNAAKIAAVAGTATRWSASNSVASSSRLFSSSPTSSDTAIEPSSQSSTQSLPPTTFAERINHVPVVFPNPPPHPRPYGIHVATLRLSAHHPHNLDLYTQFAYHAAHSLGIPTTRPAFLPRSKELITVIKAPFVHKKWQENFERRHHRRAIEVYDASRETIDLWLRYLKKNGIGGVGMRARVHEFVDVGFGAKELEGLEGQLDKFGASASPQQAVEAAAKKLIEELSKSSDNPPPVAKKPKEIKVQATAPAEKTSSAPPKRQQERRDKKTETLQKTEAAKEIEQVRAAASQQTSGQTAEPVLKVKEAKKEKTMKTAKKEDKLEAATPKSEVAPEAPEVKDQKASKRVAKAAKPTKEAEVKAQEPTMEAIPEAETGKKVKEAKKAEKAEEAKEVKEKKEKKPKAEKAVKEKKEKPAKEVKEVKEVKEKRIYTRKAKAPAATAEEAQGESVEQRSRGETEASISADVPVESDKVGKQ